jgi:hypothetical protein
MPKKTAKIKEKHGYKGQCGRKILLHGSGIGAYEEHDTGSCNRKRINWKKRE